MKRFIKMLTVTCVAALAVTAMAAAGASAATFTASETGQLKGNATTNQVFTVNSSSKVTCKEAHSTGEITSKESSEQHVTVVYGGCSATFFGFPAGTMHISPATYNFTANGEVHLLNTVSIQSTGLGCTTEVHPQSLKTVTYTNSHPGIVIHANITGIVSTSKDGCPSGTAGTYTGSNYVERVGGGTLSWDK